ncbi:MAG: Holliday junction resolvase RuvX [Pseudomonadota bacterium]
MTATASPAVYEDAAAFRAAMAPMAVLLGLDLGTRTIGVAVADRLGTVATPRVTIRRGKFTQDAAELAQIARDTDAAGLVLGLPRNMDGSEGPRAQATRAFARNLLAGHLMLPILLWDERLSTVAAERALLEADTSRAKRAAVIDQVAASVILQGALDRLSHLKQTAEGTAHG